MKKIYLAFLMVCAMLTSCDMDKTPWGSLDDETGLASVNDAYRFRNGFYVSLKGMNAGGYFAYPDIQCDQFIGLTSNGNRMGQFSNALFNAGEGEFATFWAGCYTRINSANYFIERVEPMIESGNYTGADLAELKRYVGEAKFLRAYSYWFLLDKFCENYSKVGGSTPAKGLPLVTVYNPTGDTSKYPGRSTQDETYTLVESDLTDAYNALKEYEASGVNGAKDNVAPMAKYLSSWAVVALQARVALLKGDYPTAYNKAREVIESGVYTLSDTDNYADMWTNDDSQEIIFRPAASQTELPASTGGYYLGTNQKSADYIPTQAVLYAYDTDDVRFKAFFKQLAVEVEGARYGVYAFNKFPGNAELKVSSTTPNFCNYPKVFRLSEMYLIAAEAGIQVNLSGANKYMNDFMKNRYTAYEEESFTASSLTTAVRNERYLEFIGEGMRLSDLRRWGQGFTRSVDYSGVNPSAAGIIVPLGAVTYSNDDHRLVWPIPSDEIETNPQIKGQQNPGY